MSLVVVNTHQDLILEKIDKALLLLLDEHNGVFKREELTIIVPKCVLKAMEIGQPLSGVDRIKEIFGIDTVLQKRKDIVIRTKNYIVARKTIPQQIKKAYS